MLLWHMVEALWAHCGPAQLLNRFSMDTISEGQVQAGKDEYMVDCSEDQAGALAGCLQNDAGVIKTIPGNKLPGFWGAVYRCIFSPGSTK